MLKSKRSIYSNRRVKYSIKAVTSLVSLAAPLLYGTHMYVWACKVYVRTYSVYVIWSSYLHPNGDLFQSFVSLRLFLSQQSALFSCLPLEFIHQSCGFIQFGQPSLFIKHTRSHDTNHTNLIIIMVRLMYLFANSNIIRMYVRTCKWLCFLSIFCFFLP